MTRSLSDVDDGDWRNSPARNLDPADRVAIVKWLIASCRSGDDATRLDEAKTALIKMSLPQISQVLTEMRLAEKVAVQASYDPFGAVKNDYDPYAR